MNEKGANIDLLFRNGLKDYEVLPPPGVWDGIQPAIKVKSRPVLLLRVAAVVTVLVTLSLLTYKWSSELTSTPTGPEMAFNVPASYPLISTPIENHEYLPLKKISPVKSYSDIFIDTADPVATPQEIQSSTSPEQIVYVQETKRLSIANSETIRGPFTTTLNTSLNNQAKVKYGDLQYFQDNTVTKPKNRWSIAAMASPTYYSSFNTGSDGLSKELSSLEQSLVSYSGGVAFSYKINKRFSIQSGLYYSSLGQRVDGINSYSGFKPYDITKGDYNFRVLTTSGTVYANNPDVFLSANGSDRILTAYTNDVFDPNKASLQPINNSLNQNFSYLELPVVLRYKIVDKTIGINLIGGLSYNLLVSNSAYVMKDGTKYSVGDTKGLNPLALSSSLGMGMEYNLSGKLSLNLEPTFRYYLNPFSPSTGSFIHPYSFGIFSGVSYKF